MGVAGFLHLLWLVPLSAIGLFALAVAYATASAGMRHRRYIAGGLDLVDADMTQEQFGRYLSGYFRSTSHNVSILQQSEATGTLFLVEKDGQQRVVYAKRSRNGVSDAEVTQALEDARTDASSLLIVTNSVLSWHKNDEVKKQGVEVWDREKLIPYMGKAGARRFALQAIESDHI